MPSLAEFQHQPSAQPSEPEDSDSPMLIALSSQNEAPAATEEPTKHSAVVPVSTPQKDVDYVCDSAFEHVPAPAQKLLMDEAPSSPLDFDFAHSKRVDEAEVVQSVAAAGSLSERERQIVAECWKEVQAKSAGKVSDATAAESLDVAGSKQHEDDAAETGGKPKGGRFSRFLPRGQGGHAAATKGEAARAGAEKSANKVGEAGFAIPKTFDEMARMNARLVGADEAWISVVLKSFDDLIVGAVSSDDARLQSEVTVLALRAHKACSKPPNMKDFRVCMMTSLRALVPQRWDSEHEGAWLHLWSLVEERSTPVMPLPAKYGSAVEAFVSGLTPERKTDIGMAVFDRMFKEWPKSEMFFKQSNSRLCFLVGRAVELAAQAYREPDACVNELLALGLKHIMYRVPTEYFEPFSSIIAEEVEARCGEPLAAEGLCWALDLVAYTMVRAITEGSTPLLRAIAENNPKKIRKALGAAPRADRAKAALHT